LADIVTAIVELLKADADVAALCGGRVFGGELPPDEPQSMPRHAIVVQPSGGVPFQPAGRVKADSQRLDIIAYGPTVFEAVTLRQAVAPVLTLAVRVVSSGVLVHWVQSAGGFMTGRDRDGQWPYAFQSFQTLYSTDEAA
jgi:hypothetical protein